MNRIIVIFCFMLLGLSAGCKKDRDRISHVVDVSFPTITVNGQSATATSQDDYYTQTIGTDQTGFLSIAPGQSLTVSAYDSMLNETANVMVESDGAFDASTPGLYLLEYSARNSNGYYTLARFYVAVTDEQNTMLEGRYISDQAPADTFDIFSLAPGLYLNTDAGGNALGVYGVMAHLDNNTVVMPEQPTDFGSFAWGFGDLSSSPDTTISFTVINELYDPEDTVTIRWVRPL